MSYTDKLQQIDAMKQAIENYGKLSTEILNKINYKFRLEWNYTSNSMEGNSLTKQETRSVMVGNITVEGKPIKDVLEIKGHDEVISQIIKMGKGELNISEKRIKEIHKGIIHEEDPEKKAQIGLWKAVPNYLTNYKNERFDFTAPADVPEKMHELINWLNTEKEKIQRNDKDAPHPVQLALQFHLDYITIHPFYDGNGRTVRILTNLILINYGYPPLYVKENEKERYYQYLADIQGYGGAPDLFYDFMAGLLIRSMQIVLDAIEGKDIEEPDDWEKKLALLKKQLSADEEVKITRSVVAVLEIIHKSAFPLIEKVMAKLSDFDDLFAEKKIDFGGKNSQYLIETLEQAKQNLKIKNDEHMDEINFSYSLNGFKRAGTNTFSVRINLKWQFTQFKYYFFLNHNEYNKAIARLYHQLFTDNEINSFVSECGNELLKQIEFQLNRK